MEKQLIQKTAFFLFIMLVTFAPRASGALIQLCDLEGNAPITGMIRL